MHVKLMMTIEYKADGSWRAHKTPDPGVAAIEAAIRRLDQERFPSFSLWPVEDEGDISLAGDQEVFEVMGGCGAYWLAGTLDGYFQRRLDDPARGDEEVAVWISDQGFADEARHVATDVATVIRAAWYYAEHGEFDPSLAWEATGTSANGR